MEAFDSLQIAFRALRLHKVRSGLTVLGLIIGVMAIILVINLGQGIKAFIVGQVEVFGTDFVEVEIKVPATSKTSAQNAIDMAQGVLITTLKEEDAIAVSKHYNIRDYYSGLLGQEVLSYGAEKNTTMLWGVSASFFDLYNTPVVEGRGFTEEENRSQSRVVVIGKALREKFFQDGEAIGRQVSLGNKKFAVIGVMDEQGSLSFLDMDKIALLPVRTLQKQVMGVDHLQFIIAYMKDTKLSAVTAAELTDIMREQHNITDPKKDDFAVTTAEEAMEILGTVTNAITLLLVAIAGVSLLVGGVGIMNIMYVSVKERTYEIGLRKAVGANNKNILWQFLWEAIVLTFTGGFAGIVLGSLLSIASALGAQAAGFDWPVTYSATGLVLAFGFSVLVGIIFGIYPAKKAASLEVVEALRME